MIFRLKFISLLAKKPKLAAIMSSHHFVREKQEPALLILADRPIPLALMEELLEWCPMIMIDDRCLYLLNHQPIKLDYVLQCSLNTDDLLAMISFQEQVNTIDVRGKLNIAKDAVDVLVAKGHDAISILGMDEQEFKRLASEQSAEILIAYYHDRKVFSLDHEFSKWKSAGAVFQFEPPPIGYQNLKKEGNDFVVMDDGLVEVQFSERTNIIELDTFERSEA